jgi:hypothetical protein
VCDGINFATIDPSKGPVQAYNNVIYHVGTGPDPQGELSNYACISSPGITNRGKPGSGTAEWFNNTLYDCGPRGGSNAGAFNVGAGSPTVRLRNNIVYAKPGESYLEPAGDVSHISGSNNLWFGAGNAPSRTSSNLTADPKFVDLAKFDFHLQPRSPAIHAGVSAGIPADFDGVPRPQNSPSDLGAFEATAPANSSPRPTPGAVREFYASTPIYHPQGEISVQNTTSGIEFLSRVDLTPLSRTGSPIYPHNPENYQAAFLAAPETYEMRGAHASQ